MPITPKAMTRFVLVWLNRPWGIELRPGINRIGRNPTNDFRVSESSISSFHCEIYLTDRVATVRDVGSTNGTFVAGNRVTECRLDLGQILRLGNAEFKLEETTANAAEAPFNMVPSNDPTQLIPKPDFAMVPEPTRNPSFLARITQSFRHPRK